MLLLVVFSLDNVKMLSKSAFGFTNCLLTLYLQATLFILKGCNWLFRNKVFLGLQMIVCLGFYSHFLYFVWRISFTSYHHSAGSLSPLYEAATSSTRAGHTEHSRRFVGGKTNCVTASTSRKRLLAAHKPHKSNDLREAVPQTAAEIAGFFRMWWRQPKCCIILMFECCLARRLALWLALTPWFSCLNSVVWYWAQKLMIVLSLSLFCVKRRLKSAEFFLWMG